MKKISRRNFLQIAGVSAAALGLAACGGSSSSTAASSEAATSEAASSEASAYTAGQFSISYAHTMAEDDIMNLGAVKFKEYVEEASQGAIVVDVYPNSQMGPEVDVIQSILSNGGIDMTFTGESMQTYEPDLGMIGMPYLIQSDEHMDTVLNGDVGKEFEALMEKAGMKCLGYYVRGPRYITSTKKKITCVADCQNLVIRTPSSAMTVAAFEAVGAKPTPMSLSEVFTSLQQGTIEAQENPMAQIQTNSFYEVCDYLILTAHLRAWVYICMGVQQFSAFPEDLQTVIADGVAECQSYYYDLFVEQEQELSDKLQEEGMEFVEVDQSEFAAAMIEGVKPVLTDSQLALYEEIAALV